jgi:hypothetical protein
VTERRLRSRREFLVVGVAVGAPAALLPLRPWRALVQIEGSASPGARLSGLLEHRDSARVIGREYLRRIGGRPTTRALVDSITSGLPRRGRSLGAATDDELRGMLAVQIRRDFGEERTIALQGWIVSLTEARLCALAAVA